MREPGIPFRGKRRSPLLQPNEGDKRCEREGVGVVTGPTPWVTEPDLYSAIRVLRRCGWLQVDAPVHIHTG